MRRLLLVLSLTTLALACNTAAPVATDPAPAATPPQRPQTQIAHGDNTQAPAANTTSKWKQSGDPIDTKAFDTAIATAEVAFKKSPSDESIKKKLGDAYFARAMALTDPARQYASALGDFRRAVKYDPSNTEAKEWIDKIVMIYDSMGRAYPKEGEEPPPLTKNN